MLKDFMTVLKISKLQGFVWKTQTRSTTFHVVFPEDVTQYAFFSTARSMFTEGPETKSLLKVSEMAEKLDAENILLITDSYKVRW